MQISDSQLRALIEGTLPDEEVRMLERAIEESPELLERLENLSGASQFKEEFSVEKQDQPTRWQQWLEQSDNPESLGKLGEFEILEEIACGGMGVVFRGFDSDLNRTVAVKMLLPHYVSNDEAKERFIREATAAATVEHEHVLPIYAVNKSSALLPFFVMRFVDGESLEDRLRKGQSFKVKEIVRIGHAIASGLAAAHAKGCVHRDIKPSNILLEGGGGSGVWIVDFGLVQMASEADLTMAGTFMGTPAYCSPEQGDGKQVDFRTDLFSLGSVLYVMATGEAPFKGETQASLIFQIVSRPHSSLHQVDPATPAWLSSIVDALLQKDPQDRPNSAQAVVQAFKNQQKLAVRSQGTTLNRRRVLTGAIVATALGGASYLGYRALWGLNDKSAGVRIKDPGREGTSSLVAALSEEGSEVVELDFDGEMDVPPLNLVDRPRWIRAVPGRSPLLRSSKSKLPLFTTRSDLVLEGLKLQTTAQGQGFDQPLIDSEGGLLGLCNCRLQRLSRTDTSNRTTTPLVRIHGTRVVNILNCEFYAPQWQIIFFDLGSAPIQLQCSIDHSILFGGIAMTFDSSTSEANADVSLNTNLFASQNVINLFHGDSSAFPMNFSAEQNLFEAGRAVFNLQKQLKTLRTMVTWEGRDNSYAARDAFVLTSNPRSMGRIETLQDWYRQWSADAENSGSREVLTEFDPESVPSDQPGKPDPGDFRHLAKASGVPINLELVGPSGYQSGTEGSIEYRDWKKRCEEVFG